TRRIHTSVQSRVRSRRQIALAASSFCQPIGPQYSASVFRPDLVVVRRWLWRRLCDAGPPEGIPAPRLNGSYAYLNSGGPHRIRKPRIRPAVEIWSTLMKTVQQKAASLAGRAVGSSNHVMPPNA